MTTTAATTATTTTTAITTAESETWTTKTEPTPTPVPIPVLAPYVGLVASVLCTLGGGWLLLAPYALDFRHGAAHFPRTAVVDLASGAAITAVGITAALLFSVSLVLRLRAGSGVVPQTKPAQSTAAAVEPGPGPGREPASEPEPEPAPGASAQEADPGGALRELLTPLVAALAADLRSHDEERRRQEP